MKHEKGKSDREYEEKRYNSLRASEVKNLPFKNGSIGAVGKHMRE